MRSWASPAAGEASRQKSPLRSLTPARAGLWVCGAAERLGLSPPDLLCSPSGLEGPGRVLLPRIPAWSGERVNKMDFSNHSVFYDGTFFPQYARNMRVYLLLLTICFGFFKVS